MKLTHVFLSGALLVSGVASAAEDSGRTEKQQEKKEKTDAKAKEGALKEKKDPAADLKLQEQNLKRLRQNAAQNRHAGNRAGAWAADLDARHVEKLIKKDKKALAEGKSKK